IGLATILKRGVLAVDSIQQTRVDWTAFQYDFNHHFSPHFGVRSGWGPMEPAPDATSAQHASVGKGRPRAWAQGGGRVDTGALLDPFRHFPRHGGRRTGVEDAAALAGELQAAIEITIQLRRERADDEAAVQAESGHGTYFRRKPRGVIQTGRQTEGIGGRDQLAARLGEIAVPRLSGLERGG